MAIDRELTAIFGVTYPAIPSGCFPKNEWTASYVDDNGNVVVSDCTEYYHCEHGVFGVLEITSVNGDVVSAEFVKYDESL